MLILKANPFTLIQIFVFFFPYALIAKTQDSPSKTASEYSESVSKKQISTSLIDQKPLNAKQVADLLKKFSNPHLLNGQFVQTKYIKDIDISLKSEGFFTLTQISRSTQNILWKIEKPEKINICIDENTLIIENLRLNKKNKINLNEVQSSDDTGLSKLSELFKLNSETLLKNYKVYNKNNTLLLLPLNNNNSPFTKAELILDPKKNIRSLFIKEENQDTLSIQFKNIQETQIKNTNKEIIKCI